MARIHRNNVNKDELTRNKSNPKRFWRSIHNDILPNNKSKLLNLLDPITNMPLDPKEIPTKIDEFFSEIGPRLADSLPDVDIDNFNIDIAHNDEVIMFEIGLTDIETVINISRKFPYINHLVYRT